MTDGRNLALDGVRGLAALSVALGHCMLIVAGMEVWSKTAFDFPAMPAQEIAGRLMHLLFPGNGAVMVFFVLSGYVLWGSFARKQSTVADTPDYLVARLFRLLPLVMATTLLYWLVTFPTPGELVANMVLLSTSMNKVLWSLQVEMIGSLVIFIAWLFVRNDPVKLFVALCVVAAAVPFFRGNQFVVYLPAFLLGALIHHVPARIWQSRALLIVGARRAAAAEHRLLLSRHDAAAGNPRRGRDRRLRRRAAPADARNVRRSGSSARSAIRSM